MGNQPNIFNYATSELSQDAFIAWLLEWADTKYKLDDEHLHQLGLDFLQSLITKRSIEIDEITEIEVKTQFHKIDVFVSFTMKQKKYALIIEDKVHTTDHSNQLEKYKNKIASFKMYDDIIPIYFKTGYQVNLIRIEQNKYHHYTVKDLLDVLTPAKITQIDSDLLTQYYCYILEKERGFDRSDIESKFYLDKPVSEWRWWSYVRFFHDYKQHFNGHWHSVPNARGPLLAFWFGNSPIKVKNEHTETIQLELYTDILYSNSEMKLSFRISLMGNRQTNSYVRNKVYNAFQPYLHAKNIKCKKPRFTRAKETLRLAEVINLNRTLSYKGLIEQLETCQEVVNQFTKEYEDA